MVPNHMTGGIKGLGWAGTPYDGIKQEYAGIPYSPVHFNMNIKGRCPSESGNFIEVISVKA